MQCRKTCGVHSVLAVAWIGTVLLLTSAQRVRPDLKQLALLVLIDKVDRNTQRLPVVETHPQLHNLISQESSFSFSFSFSRSSSRSRASAQETEEKIPNGLWKETYRAVAAILPRRVQPPKVRRCRPW
jgi:hypothetical protein